MDGVVTLAQRKVWAREQFGAAQLADARRTGRLVKLAEQMAGNSSGSIPQQTGRAADMKAAYRLFAAPQMTHAAVLGPHLAQTRARASALPQVFLVQDTAQLNFSAHVHCEGLGPIGHGKGLCGLHRQNVLALDPGLRRPLGLMYQQHHRRQERPTSHGRTEKRRTPLAARESHWWVEAIRQIGRPPAGVGWVHVGDRGEDIYGVYDEVRRQGARLGRVSAAAALRAVRQALECTRWRQSSSWFVAALRAALRDDYHRRRSKRARDWPHKKKDPLPRPPNLRTPTRRKNAFIQAVELYYALRLG